MALENLKDIEKYIQNIMPESIESNRDRIKELEIENSFLKREIEILKTKILKLLELF